ncbi:MAG TPA: response regulator transcription factor [Casimicrobiaceae bacterium]|jgi:DNA-binding NarL/FixJ family response regulator|nr:response regulator transcription factor [Casimicrobiaceae bacterium]
MSAMPKIRVLLADDHKLFRAGIRSLLQTLDDIEVVAEAGDGREALRLAAAHRPDVVLMDIMMPNLNGLDAAARIAHAYPHTRVIMLSMSADEDSVLKTLRAGAVGYLVKTADPAELELAIRAAMRGEKFLSSAVSEHVVSVCLNRLDKEQTSLERLTPRQREVLQLVAESHTTKDIAKRLEISTKTAEAYRGELMRALDIHDIASLTRYAIRTGLVSLDS